MVATFISRRSNVRGRINGPVDYILIDLGVGGLRMGCSNEGDEDCREIGNYPEAQAGTPSLVPQAPSDIIYQPNDSGPAEAVAFGHVRRRIKRGQTTVTKVKIALLPDPASYGYAHALLVAASKTLKLESVQQIPEDFLRLAIGHAIKECSGHPRKGWVFSAPHSYSVDQGRMFRELIQRAGCTGSIYIQNESDCVAYANLLSIEDIVEEERNICFKQGRNFSVATAVLDLGAGTADMTISEIFFHVDGTPPTMKELRAPLCFAIGGDLFDERFYDVLRAKLDIKFTPEEEQSFFRPFIDHFHKQSKPLWPICFEDEEYPFHVPKGKERFVLTVDDMTCIMNPPIDEICRRIAKHLNGLELKLIVASGGNSELPGMMPRVRAMLKERSIVTNDDQVIHIVGQSSNTIIHGLHYWINHPQLVKGRYARMTLARVVKRHRSELARQMKVLDEDTHESKFYDCAERIMSKGDFIPDGVRNFDVYYDLDADAKVFDVRPMLFCVPNKGSQTHISGIRVWNFASECRPVGSIDLVPTLANLNVADLRRIPKTGKRRCWLRLGVKVGIDVTITVSWKCNGQMFDDGGQGSCSATLILSNLDLPDQTLVNEFRAPIEQQQNSDPTISEDTLPNHLKKLRAAGGIQEPSQEVLLTDGPSYSKDQGISDIHTCQDSVLYKPALLNDQGDIFGSPSHNGREGATFVHWSPPSTGLIPTTAAKGSARKRSTSQSESRLEHASKVARHTVLANESSHNSVQACQIPPHQTNDSFSHLPLPYVPLPEAAITHNSSPYYGNILMSLPSNSPPLPKQHIQEHESMCNTLLKATKNPSIYFNDLQHKHLQPSQSSEMYHHTYFSPNVQHLNVQSRPVPSGIPNNNSASESQLPISDYYNKVSETSSLEPTLLSQHGSTSWACPPVVNGRTGYTYSGQRFVSQSTATVPDTITKVNNEWITENENVSWPGMSPSPSTNSELLVIPSALPSQLTTIERTMANWMKKHKVGDLAILQRARYLAGMIGNDEDLSAVNAPGWLGLLREKLGIVELPSLSSQTLAKSHLYS